MNKRKKIGLLIDRFYYRLPIDIFHGVQKAAAQYGYEIVVFSGCIINSADPGRRQSNILYEFAFNSRLDGLIIASNLIATEINSDELKGFCRQYTGIPVISLGLAVEGVPGIVIDNFGGMYSIINHIIREHDRRKVVFIGGPEKNRDARERLQAYRKALEDNEVTVDKSFIVRGNFMENVAAGSLRDFITENDLEPGRDFDAVIGVNDFSARGAILELQRKGVIIPGQVAVAGFDDVSGMKNLKPPLSTVKVDFSEMGAKAVHVLAGYFSGNALADTYTIPTQTVIRGSCGCMVSLCDPVAEETKPLLSGKREKHGKKSSGTDAASRQMQTRNNRDDLLLVIQNRIKQEIDRKYSAGVDFDFYSELWETIGEDAEMYYQRYINSMYYTRLGQYLANTVKIREITDILQNNLPQIGIHECCVVLYDPPPSFSFPQPLPAASRLVMAFTKKRIFPLPDAGISFSTLEILPPEVMGEFGTPNLIVDSLFFREQQIGYIIFSAEGTHERLFTDIRALVSNSLQTAMMVTRIQNNETILKHANEQIRELNEKLNEENLQMHAEMKVAEMIQTVLLPKNMDSVHADFDINGRMLPAEEIGGDFFDVIKISEECFWAGIGDVSGHGLTSGLIMMMTQAMHSLVIRNSGVTPGEVLKRMNQVLLENIGNRLEENKYMTFTSLKYLGEGEFLYAGLHQDIIVFRKKAGICQLIPTNGSWLNLMPDISKVTVNETLRLDRGDIMILFTDGLTELFDNNREMFGIERLCRAVEENASAPAEKIVDAVFRITKDWSGGKFKDDMSLLVLKYKHVLALGTDSILK
ncbi:MAG: SpoIIE family protein phosphatase [Spirochaetales bacterium]|nr:SpoIIE family protein phosphatase [Spirochaetales bacterium]